MGVILPPEYQQVEFLKSSGTQYFDLVYTPTALTKMILSMSFATTTTGQLTGIGGDVGGSNSRFAFGITTTTGHTNQWYCGIGNLNTWNGSKDTGRHIFTIDAKGKQFSVDSTTYSVPYTAGIKTSGKLLLLARQLNTITNYISGTLYSFELFEDDLLVMSLIPCYRKSDSKPGMYDLVTKQFFTNQGTGEFLVGPDVIDSISPWLVARRRALMNVPRLPIEYQEVPFIIGQGAQYIDTGYVLTSGCRVQGKYNLYTKLGSVMALFGARDSNYNNAFAMFNVTGAPRIDYGKTLTTHSFSYSTINDRSIVVFDLNAGIATVNGRTYAFDDSLKPFTCPSTAMIFAAHTGDTIDTRCPKGEIVYLKITDENGIVVRDMVPCYRKSDNKPGMYDLANNQFYTNAGTGEFQLPS